jgi:pimeloyl-ACP methyl ester carboxylesterase
MRAVLFLVAVTAYAAPCTTPNSACTEWISVTGWPERLLIYRSHPVDTKNSAIKRALILVHGGARDADQQFRSALAAAFLAGALDDTIILAPRFSSNRRNTYCQDLLATNEANWGCADGQPDSWRNGAAAMRNGSLTSYDFADEIMRKLARKDVFPNLKAIVMAGHSGGGQFALRYGMSNRVHNKLGLSISYVVSNADALVYLDSLRPTAAAYPVSAAAPGFVPPAPIAPFIPFPDAGNCSAYNNWPYGLQHRTGYTAGLTDAQIEQQLAARPVTYLLGGLDILPIEGFDASCPAMAQGPTRFARGQAFARYVNEKIGAKHKVIEVPTCGHDARCIVTSEQALRIIFPEH